jgi:carboxyl-terminal processing protease
MSTKRSNRRFALLVAAICAVSFVLGGAAVSAARSYGPPVSKAAQRVEAPAIRPASPPGGSVVTRHGEIVALLADNYYRTVDVRALARVPLANLPVVLHDPYTRYLAPAQLVEYNRGDTGTYTGVGVHAKLVHHDVVLDRVTARGPAAAAGLRVGDVLVSADGRRLRGLELEVALQRVRGLIGTTVSLQIRRGHKSLTVAVRRAEVPVRVVFHEVRQVSGQQVGYIQVLEFSEGVGSAVRAAVEDLKTRGVDEIVLDLRHNGGGLVSQAIELTAAFTPVGTSVFVESGKHIETATYRTRTAPVDTAIPLGVLVDRESASAAEIVTGALRDDGRAEVFGAKTFGKGVIQKLALLKGGGALKYTMAEYLTPSGRRVNHVGITPDVAVVTPKRHDSDDADLAFNVAAQTLIGH